jgi:hypothetical protein
LSLGLDSVSASRVAKVLREISHDPVNPIPVIASIHQPRYVRLFSSCSAGLRLPTPSSHLYQQFDTILVLSQGHNLYSGAGAMTPIEHFIKTNLAPPYLQGYNVADYLLEVASDPPVGLFDLSSHKQLPRGSGSNCEVSEKGRGSLHREGESKGDSEGLILPNGQDATPHRMGWRTKNMYATTFLTQLQHLSGREWKILRRCSPFVLLPSVRLIVESRDKSLFITHTVVASVLGVFCGGHTGSVARI